MMLGTSWIDWKLGGRMLVKNPGLTVIGGLAIALAIGIGAAWFEVTRQLLNPRVPLPEGDRIVRIRNWDAAANKADHRLMYDLQLWREQLTSIKGLGAYRTFERNLITPDGNGQPAAVAEISASAFPVARVPALLGRSLLETDEVQGAADVVVIGYDVWQSRFNGDYQVLGQVVRLGRMPATIVGVMPDGFRFPISQQVWTPLRMSRNTAPREGPSITVFGRLADGASLESAQRELTNVGRRIAALNPDTHAQLRPRVLPYASAISGSTESALVRLTNIVAWLILAVAGANVATLMFARTATREAEIVVRSALGASRTRVIMQLLVEAFVLCAVGAVVGLLAASFALDYGLRMWVAEEGQVPFWAQFNIRALTVAYAAILALGAAVVVGLLPALKATGARVQTALTQMSTGTSIRFGGVWSVLIALQVAFATLCLPLGFAATFYTLRDRAARSPLPAHEYLTFRLEVDEAASLPTVFEALKQRLQDEPVVAAVTFSNSVPGTHFPVRQVEAQRAGDPPFIVDANLENNLVRVASVDIGFFDAYQFPLVAGRVFHGGDVTTQNAVIINETLALNIGGNPLGVRVRLPEERGYPASPWYEVVGIVREFGMQGPKPDFIFRPVSLAAASTGQLGAVAGVRALDMEQLPPRVSVHVRGSAAAFAPRVSAIAAEVDPSLRLYDLLPLEEVVRQRQRPELNMMIGILALTLLVSALSAAGLYSLMSVAVTRRTREIGIRLAIGASPRAVIAAVFARAALQVGIGVILAVALIPPLMTALGISELKLNEVLVAMAVAASGMLLVALVACGVPARKALSIQATEAMRYTG